MNLGSLLIYIRVGGGGGVSQLHGALFMEDNVLFMTRTRHGLLLNTIKEEERRRGGRNRGARERMDCCTGNFIAKCYVYI